MKFCSHCAAELEERVPPGDDRARKVCAACGSVHYQNPVVVVGCVVERDDEILLCRRAIEPARGRWTLPAGFLEIGEGMHAGARRETYEEARADVEIVAPHAHIDLPHIGQAYALFRARLREPEVGVGPESLEVAFFGLDAMPWDELAFPAVYFALEFLVKDRRDGAVNFHSGVLEWGGEGSRFSPSAYAVTEYLRVPFA